MKPYLVHWTLTSLGPSCHLHHRHCHNHNDIFDTTTITPTITIFEPKSSSSSHHYQSWDELPLSKFHFWPKFKLEKDKHEEFIIGLKFSHQIVNFSPLFKLPKKTWGINWPNFLIKFPTFPHYWNCKKANIYWPIHTNSPLSWDSLLSFIFSPQSQCHHHQLMDAHYQSDTCNSVIFLMVIFSAFSPLFHPLHSL